jgi:hypothetical protein
MYEWIWNALIECLAATGLKKQLKYFKMPLSYGQLDTADQT